MAQKPKSSMPVKILVGFTSPLSGLKLKPGDCLNVPKSQFWFKRCEQKDCEKLKSLPQPKPSSESKSKSSKKGSK